MIPSAMMTVTCATKVAVRNKFVTTLRFPIAYEIYSNYFMNKNLVIYQNEKTRIL